jgi:rubrerythrin
MFRADEVFDLAIRLEKNGENCYRHLLSLTTDSEARPVLHWLAEQETQHAVFFSRLRQRYPDQCPTELGEAPAGLNLADFLADRALSLDEVDILTLTDRQRILQVALEFERDTILFFDMLRAFIDDDHALTQLDAIIEEERRHIELLEDLIAQGEMSITAPVDKTVLQIA